MINLKDTTATCSFRVMSLSTHKIQYWKVFVMRVWIHNLLFVYFAYSSNPENRCLQQYRSRFIGRTSLYDLQFSSSACKYTQNSIRERDCNTSMEPYLADLSSHAALIKKRIISDSRAFVWSADRLYMPRSFFQVCVRKKKERKKKMEKKENEFFIFDFLSCDKDQWSSGDILYIGIPKGFHL